MINVWLLVQGILICYHVNHQPSTVRRVSVLKFNQCTKTLEKLKWMWDLIWFFLKTLVLSSTLYYSHQLFPLSLSPSVELFIPPLLSLLPSADGQPLTAGSRSLAVSHVVGVTHRAVSNRSCWGVAAKLEPFLSPFSAHLGYKTLRFVRQSVQKWWMITSGPSKAGKLLFLLAVWWYASETAYLSMRVSLILLWLCFHWVFQCVI